MSKMVMVILPQVESGVAGLEEQLREWGGQVVHTIPRVFTFEDSLRLVECPTRAADRARVEKLLGDSTTALDVDTSVVYDWAAGLLSPSQSAVLRRLFERLARATPYAVVAVRDSGSGEECVVARPMQVFDVVDAGIRGKTHSDVTVVHVPSGSTPSRSRVGGPSEGESAE